MTYLQRLLGATSSLSADEERWWTQVASPVTTSGVQIGADTALKISAVYACDRLLAETIASLPALVFERMADESRQRATNHPLYDVLHTAPNARQTPFEFFDFMTHCAIMRGGGYARILPGRRGFADQLDPIHPDRVTEEVLKDGRLRYRVRSLDGASEETLTDEDVLHVRGMSADGIRTVSVVSYARDSFGLGLAAERYGARFFRNNARPGGVLETDQELKPATATRVTDSWNAMHAGENQHRVALLEQGLKWHDVGISQKDSQFIETREFQAEDVCRWFRVPPHMIGLTSKVTSWGSGIEQLGLGFITYTLMPWLVRWQQAITRDLILAPQKYYVEFLVDALLRGDLKSRYDAYAIGRINGWLATNEIRRRENLNPIPGGDDDYLLPLNMRRADETPQPQPPAPSEGPAPSGHYLKLVYEAAGRVVRKELAALGRAAARASGADDFARAVSEFYADHAEFVAQSLQISPEIARRYVAEQVQELRAGPAVMHDWNIRRVADLATLVLEANHANS